jgi:hypothetical protein
VRRYVDAKASEGIHRPKDEEGAGRREPENVVLPKLAGEDAEGLKSESETKMRD